MQAAVESISDPTIESTQRLAIHTHVRIVQWCLGLVGAVALLDLAGWLLGIDRATSVLLNYATMKPNTAACLALLALCCWWKRDVPSLLRSWLLLASNLVAAVVALISLATLYEYLAGHNLSLGALSLDQLLIHVPIDAVGGPPGRPSAGTAICLSLLSLALFALDRLPRLSLGLLLASLALTLSALIGFVFDAGPLFGVPWLRSIAVHTAASLLLLQFATLALRPTREPFHSFDQLAHRESRLRLLLPFIALMPLIIALPLLLGMRSGVYDAPFAFALLVVLLTAIQTLIVWQDSRALALAEARRHQAETALLQSEKLALVGRLSASIAHEINNPLDAVLNLLYLMREEPSLSTVREYGLQAEGELARVTQIASQTLSFYRENRRAASCEVQGIISGALKLLNSKIRASGIIVTTQISDPLPQVECKEGEIRQVLINLISNALEATDHGGHLTIRTHNSQNWSPNRALSNGHRRGVRIIIADDGSGMPRSVSESIFKPFFTTKAETGNGLGLWVARDLIEKHGGFIRVWSSTLPSHHGTVFCVFLPFPS